jgi:hypothetical protein
VVTFVFVVVVVVNVFVADVTLSVLLFFTMFTPANRLILNDECERSFRAKA